MRRRSSGLLSAKVYQLKSGEVAVYDGELGERRPFDSKVGTTDTTLALGHSDCRSARPRLPDWTSTASGLSAGISFGCLRPGCQPPNVFASGGPEHVTPGEYFGAERAPQSPLQCSGESLGQLSDRNKGVCPARVPLHPTPWLSLPRLWLRCQLSHVRASRKLVRP